MQTCAICQQALPDEVRICTHCGEPLQNSASSSPVEAIPSDLDHMEIEQVEPPTPTSAAEKTELRQPEMPRDDTLASSPLATQEESPTQGVGSTLMDESAPRHRLPTQALVALLFLILLLVLSGTGSYTWYTLTRPKPIVTLSSSYHVGNMPAGAWGTKIQAQGTDFTPSSVITLFVDQSSLQAIKVKSDEQGNIKTEFAIDTNWTTGNHAFTAKDQDGYIPQQPASFVVVKPGQANTPGPYGSPPDVASFKLKVSLDATTEAGDHYQKDSVFVVTGRPDPAGGSVCSTYADGKQHHETNFPPGLIVTAAWSCQGSYKAGRIDYTETYLSLEFMSHDSQGKTKTCDNNGQSFPGFHFVGTFDDATHITGAFSRPRFEFPNCKKKGVSAWVYQINGTWSATIM